MDKSAIKGYKSCTMHLLLSTCLTTRKPNLSEKMLYIYKSSIKQEKKYTHFLHCWVSVKYIVYFRLPCMQVGDLF